MCLFLLFVGCGNWQQGINAINERPVCLFCLLDMLNLHQTNKAFFSLCSFLVTGLLTLRTELSNHFDFDNSYHHHHRKYSLSNIFRANFFWTFLPLSARCQFKYSINDFQKNINKCIRHTACSYLFDVY